MSGDTRALRFHRLAIHRMPGFPEGAFTLDDLGPGVNLVFGPNASGKSTTARALQAVLWPGAAPPRARLAASFLLGDQEWLVDLDHDRVVRHREGMEADPPPVPAAEVRHRYVLSLQALLAEEDRDLARRIVLESQGGFDVDTAARSLDFRENHGPPRGAVEGLKAAEARWDEVRRREDELRSQQAHLRDLEEERDRAHVARIQLRWLECLEERARARRDLAAAQEALDAFPRAMESLRPDDGRELEGAREALRSAADEEARAQEDAQEARKERDATGLPEEGIPEGLRSELSEDLRRAQELERKVEDLRRELEGARASRGEAARPLGLGSHETPAHLGADEVSEVDRLVRQREDLLRRKERRRERLEALPTYSSEDAARQQELDEVVGLLREWLRLGGVTPVGRRRVRRWARTASGLALVSAGGFVALPFVEGVDPLWALGGLAPALTLLAVEVARSASESLGGAEDDRRATIRQHVSRAAVEPPEEWDVGTVSDFLHRLEGEREELRRREAGARERSALSQEISDLETRLAQLERERSEMADRLSVPPDREDLAVHWLAGVMTAWWRAHEEVVERERELEEAESALRRILEGLREKLRAGVGPVEGAPWSGEEALADASGAAAALDDLDRRVEAHRRAVGELTDAERRAHTARERAQDARERANGILERLELEPDDDATVHRWMDWLEDHRQAQGTLRETEARYRDVDARLQEMGRPPSPDDLPLPAREADGAAPAAVESVEPDGLHGEGAGPEPDFFAAGTLLEEGEAGGAYAESGAAAEARATEGDGGSAYSGNGGGEPTGEARAALLEEAPPEALTDLRPVLEERAEGLEEIQERIGDIRGRLERAREKHDREVALAERMEAAEVLRQRRDEEAASAVGARLAGWLHRETRDHARPPVFRRARANFEALTHQRYRLELDEGGEGSEAFRAVDQTTGLGHALDELSDGTRVQLLLAVRLAFVESQEQGAALPLVLDEVLANADDHRAPEVMRAVAAMARGGRQIFYFTAQREELARWRAVLGDFPDVPWNVLDLTEARARGAPDRLDPPPPAPTTQPPSPEGADHPEYGRRVGVPPVHAREPVDRAHLWYLVEEPRGLHDLLSLGLERWGQLRRYVETAGVAALPAGVESFERLRARAAAVEGYLEAWLEGRGRPVERADLQESGAVSDRFLDEVDALREELGGDAAALLQALEEGRVKGFRTRNRETLETHFQAGGHLAAGEPNPPEELRRRAMVAARGVDPELPPEEVDRVLARVAGPVSGDP